MVLHFCHLMTYFALSMCRLWSDQNKFLRIELGKAKERALQNPPQVIQCSMLENSVLRTHA